MLCSLSRALAILFLLLAGLIDANTFVSLALGLSAKEMGAGDRRTVAVALLHRHGARTGPQISAAGLQWGNAVLSPVGAEMALSMGKWLRVHYQQGRNTSRGYGIFCAPDSITGEVPLSSTSCIGRNYNVKQIISQSTYFERTIRTGMGLLRGLFPSDPYAVPYIDHKPSTMDMKLGYYYSWPSANMHLEEILGYNADHDNQTLEIITQDELNAVGEALQSKERCETQQTLCILLAQDVTTCNYANDPQGEDSPTRIPDALRRNWPKFRMAQQRSNAFLYMYNNPSQQPDSYKKNNPKNLLQSSTLWERTGAFGRIFTREIILLFRKKLEAFQENRLQESSGLVPLLYHYSAHDVTIYGVLVAMGGISVTSMYAPTDSEYPEGSAEYDDMVSFLAPEFASLVMFDLLEDGNVSVSFAKPPQVYGANFTNYSVLSDKIVKLTCARPDGFLYKATECPVDDFERFTDSMKPLPSFASVSLPPQAMQQYDDYDSYAYCYTLERDARTTSCDPSSTAIPTDSSCILYRTVCPAFACDSPRFILNKSSLACVNNQQAEEDNTRYKLIHGGGGASRWFYVGTIFGSLLLGLLVGFVTRLICFERAMRQHARKSLADGILDESDATIEDGVGVRASTVKNHANKKGQHADDGDSLADSMATDPPSPTAPTRVNDAIPLPPQREIEPQNSGLRSPNVVDYNGGSPSGPASNKLSPIGSQMASVHTTPVNVAEKKPESSAANVPAPRPPLQLS